MLGCSWCESAATVQFECVRGCSLYRSVGGWGEGGGNLRCNDVVRVSSMHKTSLSFPPGFLVVHQPARVVLGVWKTGSDNVSHSDRYKVIKNKFPGKVSRVHRRYLMHLRDKQNCFGEMLQLKEASVFTFHSCCCHAAAAAAAIANRE